MFFTKCFFFKIFSQTPFCGFLGNTLSTGRIAGRSKVVYSWISPNPAKGGPTLGGVVVLCCYRSLARFIPNVTTHCVICDYDVEDLFYLFRDCPFASAT